MENLNLYKYYWNAKYKIRWSRTYLYPISKTILEQTNNINNTNSDWNVATPVKSVEQWVGKPKPN